MDHDTASHSYGQGQANGRAHADDEGDPDFVWSPVERDTSGYGHNAGRAAAAERPASRE